MSGFALRDGNIGLWVVVGALLTSAQSRMPRKAAFRIARDLVTDGDLAIVLDDAAMARAVEARPHQAGRSQTTRLSRTDDDTVSSLSRLLLTPDLQKRSVPLN